MIAVLLLVPLAACRNEGARLAAGSGGEGVSPTVAAAHAQVASELSQADSADFSEATRGLVARATGKITAADGRVLRDLDAFAFVRGDAPPTVNPSLWRHAILDGVPGLYKVTDGVFQLRGFDLANITLVEGKSGWIVIDALTSRESAAAAMAFARTQLGDRPVAALVFTHSHVDHFGGALGVVDTRDVQQRRIPIVAPARFMEEATSENVLVGIAMARRATYQFGQTLPPSATGLVDAGLGQGVVAGTTTIMEPTVIVDQPTQELELDGVRFTFHNTPGAEAPSELTFSIPERRVYGGAELLAQTMHNLLPVRGAKVRDALRWAGYLQEALEQARDAEVYVGQHNWPVWGHDRIAAFITAHRDVYKYTHDQTVRLLNAGYTPREIADKVRLPASLQRAFGARGYYGDLRHNVKAVYQFYLGAYDGNPANLNPLPPQESAKRYVALLGGVDKVVAAAQGAYDTGDFRWAAELLNHAVLAESGNRAAKELLARTYEQMAFAAEAATWRNSYLVAASELRSGPPTAGTDRRMVLELLLRTPIDRFLEAMAARLDAEEAEGRDVTVNLALSDTRERYVLWIEHAVLHFRKGDAAPDAVATLTLTRDFFVRMMAGAVGLKDAVMSDDVRVTGSTVELLRFLSLFDKPAGAFPIVTR
ncbi:MAG: alkyl sulfatase dimerization domain-containing protein [Gemmatimonadaceae bacterium]